MYGTTVSKYPTKNPMSVMADPNEVDKTRAAIANYDKRLIAWLIKMHQMLNKDEIPVEELSESIKMIEHITKVQGRRYIRDLIYPEDAVDPKIPTNFPVPSSSFQLHASFSVTTNALGNVAGFVNPLYLGNQNLSTFYINNNASLNGSSTSNFYNAVNANQNLPNQNIYQRYRLVSYALHVTYIGRWDIVSGIIGGAVTFDSTLGVPGSINFTEPNAARYGNFDLIDDSYYASRSAAMNGIRILFVPVDPSFVEYQTTNVALLGEQLHFYAQSLPPNAQCLRIDTFANFECLADASFQNYIPTTTCTPDLDQMKLGSKILSENKNLVINNIPDYQEQKSSILSKIGGGVKSYINTVLNASRAAYEYGGKGVIDKFLPGVSKIIDTFKGYMPLGQSGIFGDFTPKDDNMSDHNSLLSTQLGNTYVP